MIPASVLYIRAGFYVGKPMEGYLYKTVFKVKENP